MKRRRYFVLATAFLAGCAGRESKRTPAETTTSSDIPGQTVDGQTVRLTIYRARRGIVEAGMVHDCPLVPEDTQFLQVGVETDGEDGAADPEELFLAATVDGEWPFDGYTARVEAIDSDRQGTVRRRDYCQ